MSVRCLRPQGRALLVRQAMVPTQGVYPVPLPAAAVAGARVVGAMLPGCRRWNCGAVELLQAIGSTCAVTKLLMLLNRSSQVEWSPFGTCF